MFIVMFKTKGQLHIIRLLFESKNLITIMKKALGLIILLFTLQVSAQDKELFQKTYTEFYEIMDSLKVKVEKTNKKDLLINFQEMNSNLNTLYEYIDTYISSDKLIDNEYVLQFYDIKNQLSRLFKEVNTIENILKIIQLINKDSKLKLAHRNSESFFSPDGYRKLMNQKIRVSVLSNKGEGYKVYANNPWNFDKSRIDYKFDNLTNNSSRKFLCGYYIFWIEKDGFVSEKRLVEVCGDEKHKENGLTIKF